MCGSRNFGGQLDAERFHERYQSIFIKGVAETLTFLTKLKLVQNLSITIHTAHNNTSKLMKRIEDVFNNVRKYNAVGPSQMRDFVDIKMRRGNKSKFDSQEQLVDIVLTLMSFHYKLFHSFGFRALQTYHHEQMRDALQWAKLNLEKQIAIADTESNVIEFKKAG